MRDIEASLDWLLSIQTASGNFPTASDEIGYDRGEDELVHWCHGATGAVSLMIVAYLYFRNEKFLQVMIWRRIFYRFLHGIFRGEAKSRSQLFFTFISLSLLRCLGGTVAVLGCLSPSPAVK